MLSQDEYRWLGRDAFQLARSLIQLRLHKTAFLVVQLACQEFEPPAFEPGAWVYQQLATAQLWMVLTTAEQNIRYGLHPRKCWPPHTSNQRCCLYLIIFGRRCRELGTEEGGVAGEGAGLHEQILACTRQLCLEGEEEELISKPDMQSHLSKSVGAWLDMYTALASSSELDLEETFFQPLLMFKDMMLTAVICSAHSQVSHTHILKPHPPCIEATPSELIIMCIM